MAWILVKQYEWGKGFYSEVNIDDGTDSGQTEEFKRKDRHFTQLELVTVVNDFLTNQEDLRNSGEKVFKENLANDIKAIASETPLKVDETIEKWAERVAETKLDQPKAVVVLGPD